MDIKDSDLFMNKLYKHINTFIKCDYNWNSISIPINKYIIKMD